MADVVILPVLEYRRSRGWRKLAEISAAFPENFAASAGQRGGKAVRGSPVKGERGRFPLFFGEGMPCGKLGRVRPGRGEGSERLSESLVRVPFPCPGL